MNLPEDTTANVLLTHDDPVFAGDERFVARFRLYSEARLAAKHFSLLRPDVAFHVTDTRENEARTGAIFRATFKNGAQS